MIRTNVELLEYVNRNIKNTKTHFIEKKIARNTILVEQNQNIIFIYVIKTGIAKCYLTEDTGSDFIQEFFWRRRTFWRDRNNQ
ncbi:hypothetical protein [Bernardetia litoralis]|uniref:hypothetical protein n=1 Tax=Bernardetia litoralis TaxID=999 RepID=UPI0003141FC7|nr:hypothetical protein [Bernardetia litoralis]